MNKHVPPPPQPNASVPRAASRQPVEAKLPPPTYRYRTVRDVEVSIGRVSGEGFDADLIETAGEPYDASCADCLEARPLDDDGFCEKCRDSDLLSVAEFAAKHHPRIYLGKAAA